MNWDIFSTFLLIQCFLYFAASLILSSLYRFIVVFEAQMAVVDFGIIFVSLNAFLIIFYLFHLGIDLFLFFTVSSAFSHYNCLGWWMWFICFVYGTWCSNAPYYQVKNCAQSLSLRCWLLVKLYPSSIVYCCTICNLRSRRVTMTCKRQ